MSMRTAALKYYNKTVDPTQLECKLCGTLINHVDWQLSGSNVLKHLRIRHLVETSATIHWKNAPNTEETDEISGSLNNADTEDDGTAFSSHSNDDGLPVEDINQLIQAAEEISTRRNRSPVWLCFTKDLETNTAVCKFCGMIHRYDSESGTTGLLNHFRRFHKSLYTKLTTEVSSHNAGEQELASSVDVGKLATVNGQKNESILNDEDGNITVALDVSEMLDDDSSELAAVMTGSHSDSTRTRRLKARSIAWACFTRVGNRNSAVCKFCGIVLKNEGGTTSNLLSHFMRKHHSKYVQVKANRYMQNLDAGGSDEEATIEADLMGQSEENEAEEILLSPDVKLDELIDRRRLKNSIVWQCFTKERDENDYHECTYCAARIRSDGGSTSGMMTHFMKRHSDEYIAAVRNRECSRTWKGAGTKASLIREHFEQLSDEDWSCLFCQKLFRQPISSSSNLSKHLFKAHREQYEMIFGTESLSTSSIKMEILDGGVNDCEDDVETNGSPVSYMLEPSPKRTKILHQNSSESPLNKMVGLWQRHCNERRKEHDRQVSSMNEKLTSLQDSMRKLKEEMASIQTELKKTEDAWSKELARQKEVNQQFRSVLRQNPNDSASSDVDGSNGTLALHVDSGD